MPKETDRLKLPLPLGNENVTRESINRIFEKIDAGVATRESILIPAESDLNSYITEGEYYCPTNATVETLLNSPTGEAFHLTVEPHAGVLQTLTTFQPGNLEVFQRNYYFGWGAWKKVPTRDELEEILPQADESAQAYVDDRPWQKFPLTQDDGFVTTLSSQDLNTLLTPGFYFVASVINGPVAVNCFVEVIARNSLTLIQRVTSLTETTNSYTRYKNGATFINPWTLQTLQPNVWGAL
ncbi:pyocin knob domain-containing protein [Paenibacillus sp. PK1-4R]|uniref:pyocin knob domain-containing protein n=1 Tax=Paenibacillus sp. PK1-4R TaxID=3049075 RepID=UPI0025A1E283|nr:pyocin knob domain-containing protein [Paenibacillus sp. PK1-4R]WJM09519.1 pyocin knob domain-containing protein [Paenibacillus sp. PK1-4R]